MKNLKFSLLFVLLVSFIVGCQKEMSVEQPILNPAAGSLKSSLTGDCNPINVKGTYKSGTNVGDTNYVEVQVNVTKIGSYTIASDTTNGYSFKGTGNFTSLGLATVRLQASGKPIAAGLDDFTVMFDTSFCFFEVTVVPGANSGTPATFTLQGAPNACGSFVPNGNYVVNTALNSTNTVTVGVNVTQVGSYNITTGTVNGYSFSGSGVFTATGQQTVVLNGTGTPTAAGNNNFTVTAGSSTCTFPVTVTATAPANATFTFAGAPNACGSFVPQGTYTVNTPLGATNTVTVGVNVTVAGAYTITTNTVNGMTFAKSGTFTNTGAQTVVLNGSGTPTTAGAANFTVSSGTIPTFSFTITVTGGSTANTDYFPLTANSWWSYDDPGTPGDTLKRFNNATTTHNALTYRVFDELDMSGSSVWEYHYRRSGNDYFEFSYVDDYSVMTFDGVVEGDILFLKEGLTNNATWLSAEFSGTESGTAKKLRYKFTCVDANGTATINGKSFTNVYKIKMEPEVSTSGGPFTPEGIVWDIFYAKGIGMIYTKGTFGPSTLEYKIRNWQVL